MTDDRAILVCFRVAAGLTEVWPGSLVKQCSICKQDIWVSPIALEDLAEKEFPVEVLCHVCARIRTRRAVRAGEEVQLMDSTGTRQKAALEAVMGTESYQRTLKDAEAWLKGNGPIPRPPRRS